MMQNFKRKTPMKQEKESKNLMKNPKNASMNLIIIKVIMKNP